MIDGHLPADDGDLLTSADMAEVAFPTVRHGFDPQQVGDFVTRVATSMQSLELRIAELEAEVRVARSGDRQQLDLAAVAAALGPEGLRQAGAAAAGETLLVAIEEASRRRANALATARATLHNAASAVIDATRALAEHHPATVTVTQADEALVNAAKLLLAALRQLPER